MFFPRMQTFVLYGNVDIRDVNLGFRVSGRLLSLNVEEGDKLKPGMLIGHLDPEPYLRAQQAAFANVSVQEANFDYAQTVYDREHKLYGTGASSVDRYENALSTLNATKAELARAKADLATATLNVSDTYLYSPSTGTVMIRAVEPGTMLAANATVITVSLIDPVWVRAYVDETNLSKAKPGTVVTVYSDSLPNKTYRGVIGFVSSTAEFTPKTVESPDLRTLLVYRLRVVMQDPQHELRQGMPVTIKLASS
ncbi:MAG: efflux RND transporter periplasmic adaptor subunit [Gammaproteobacteria bacterium]|nr:efflux RND transporter periplasmic adaptor subunit [Gammaproteobacteria bacterium]MCW5584012.1 efflux RND transporter periplasmic adaptor subunit [Gammaproteobacteria bacterium]